MSHGASCGPGMGIASKSRASLRRHPRWAASVALVAFGVGAFALYWFAPWKLLIDRRVDEALPGAPTRAEEAPERPGGSSEPAAAAAGPVTLAQGQFASLEHETSGSALLIELEDGRRFLRLEGLETSAGPDLRVILSDQPPSDDWRIWDDGRYVDLGELTGNIGDSNYMIPRTVDPAHFETAVIWCRRFSVGFGVAPLDPAT